MEGPRDRMMPPSPRDRMGIMMGGKGDMRGDMRGGKGDMRDRMVDSDLRRGATMKQPSEQSSELTQPRCAFRGGS